MIRRATPDEFMEFWDKKKEEERRIEERIEDAERKIFRHYATIREMQKAHPTDVSTRVHRTNNHIRDCAMIAACHALDNIGIPDYATMLQQDYMELREAIASFMKSIDTVMHDKQVMQQIRTELLKITGEVRVCIVQAGFEGALPESMALEEQF